MKEDPTKTRLTHSTCQYIKNNTDIPAEELSEEFDLNLPLVELIQKVQESPGLQKRKGAGGKSELTKNIEKRSGTYTIKQAKKYLPYSEQKLIRKLNKGKIRGRKIGSEEMSSEVWLIREKDLRNAIEEGENP